MLYTQDVERQLDRDRTMVSKLGAADRTGKLMLVGLDPKHALEKHFLAAGYQVVKAHDTRSAIECARHAHFDAAVLISSESIISAAETIFNLRDLDDSTEIILLIDHGSQRSSRFLRPLLEHPIEHTHILTRRQLQTFIHPLTCPSPPGV